ncbi:DUF1918 domain-containing protein [Luethyella okanaganae]|uniref:DUF1918 domain-containing protein n=1 Tax=Luethyella okanaganae TaxID=69372 RepID=A0ABW1VBB8_9MICO
MQAIAGARITIRSRSVGAPDRHGKVIEVRGGNGGPPFLVRFDDGHESLVYPGPDCIVEPADAS